MIKFTFLFFAILLVTTTSAVASEQDDLEKMQQQLNQEVMSQEFLAEQPEKVEAYIKEAMEKNLKPEEYVGTHWRRGYTCRDLLRYSWQEYRNCQYYYRYHGRYYPYP
ncbi:hypothetical protein [Kaarinaea lacus]